MNRIYLDNAATTPLDPFVLEAMLPWLKEGFHNPSSVYLGARNARMAIDDARDMIASGIGCLPGEIIFTSGGTEAANLAILGTCLANRNGNRKRILLSSAEHECVLSQKELLESFGFQVEMLPVSSDGSLPVENVASTIGDSVLLVAAMHANNETGAISDASSIGKLCKENGVLYFCDCVQSFGMLRIEAERLFADMISTSAHKLYGPQGVGALYVRAGVKVQPLQLGGGQEREQRAGTENIAGIVGFGEASRLALVDSERGKKISEQRDALSKLLTGVVTVCDEQLPGHLHMRFPGAKAESVLINLDRAGVDASSGSACSSGSLEPSHVLQASGWSFEQISEAIRFTLGKEVIDVSYAAKNIEQAVAMSRN